MYFRVPTKPERQASIPTDEARYLDAWIQQQQSSRTIIGKEKIDRVVEANGATTTYTYNQNGDLATITEGTGARSQFWYDKERRLVQVKGPEGRMRHLHYRDDGRLAAIETQGVKTSFDYDGNGRLILERQGRTNVVVYRYDENGRPNMARTSRVATQYQLDEGGRIAAVQQSIDGITLDVSLRYDEHGQLTELKLPGCESALRYRWRDGRLAAVYRGENKLASFHYNEHHLSIRYSNGLTETRKAEVGLGQLAAFDLHRRQERLLHRHYSYDAAGRLCHDGTHTYTYDKLGQLKTVQGNQDDAALIYTYDQAANRLTKQDGQKTIDYTYDGANCLTQIRDVNGVTTVHHDRHGRLVRKGSWTYRYDDAGQLIEVRQNSIIIARLAYDHLGQLVLIDYGTHIERFIYGPAGERLAVTDENGVPQRFFVPLPDGILAEWIPNGPTYFYHAGRSGSIRYVTDDEGQLISELSFTPFGKPLGAAPPLFAGHFWFEALQLYYCKSRWYDAATGRFLTPDTFTGTPDDARLIYPHMPAGGQLRLRRHLLPDWLQQPRLRNGYIYCLNDPIGRIDPDGHWSFGGITLMLFGTFWTIPNTLIGLFLEITCIIGEVLRWIVYVFTLGHVSWETLGINAAASGRLDAYSLIFEGGWLGSLPLLGITFGHFVFLAGDWEEKTAADIEVFPEAYNGEVQLSLKDALLEHELRHTNQYTWWGPLYPFAYLIDRLASDSYCDMYFERDARKHSGF